MSNLITTSQAAEQIGCVKSTVTRACGKHKIGTRPGREILLTPADVRRLRKLIQEGPGNPNATEGNRFFGGKEPERKATSASK